jgi:hypothetical protein
MFRRETAAQTRTVAVNSGGLLDQFDGRRYVALGQRHTARLGGARQDRRRLVSRRRVVHTKRQLECRAHVHAGVAANIEPTGSTDNLISLIFRGGAGCQAAVGGQMRVASLGR